MDEAKHLNEDASLQYQNAIRNVYTIVIDEPKADISALIEENGLEEYYTDDVDGYTQMLLDATDENVMLDSIPEPQHNNINGLKANLLELNGTVNGMKISWIVGYVEGRYNYYQVNTWTSQEDKDKYRDELYGIIKSFRETDKRKK